MKISAVILTKNEQEKIEDSIKSVKFCDEILIIDDNSNDKTRSIANKLGAKVFEKSINADFSAQRNYGLEKALGDWVLFIDADERVSLALQNEILKAISGKYDGYYLKRQDVFLGRILLHGEAGNITLLRLAKKNSGIWKRKVHEYWDIKAPVSKLINPLIHATQADLKHYISKINFYTNLHARENYEEGKRSSLTKIIFLPKAKFILNYIFKLGFLDGLPGFVFALLMSFHSYLSWGKLWLLQKKKS